MKTRLNDIIDVLLQIVIGYVILWAIWNTAGWLRELAG